MEVGQRFLWGKCRKGLYFIALLV